MSGFELEKKSLSDQLGQQAGKIQNQVTEDSNRALLEKFKHSSNIAQDLSNLYSERPYAYARVMKQLNGVLGASKVRRLHSTVQENARKSQESAQEHKQTLKKSLLAADNTAPSQSSYELSFMGQNITVDLSTSQSDRTISCDNLRVPYLKNLHMSATAQGTNVSDVTLSASLDADFLESSNVSLTFRKNQQGKYVVNGNANVATKVKIPGLDDIDVDFNFATGGQGGSMTASFNTSTQMFGRVGGSANGSITLDDSGSQISATVSVDGDAGNGVSGVGEESSISTSSLSMSGTVTVNTNGNTVTDASGSVEVTGLNFVTDPSTPVAMSVAYDGTQFSASLDSSLELAPFTIPGTNDTVSCTIQSATYSETDQFSASGSIDVSLWNGKFTANGPVTITHNSLDSATLNIATGELALPAESPVVDGSAAGTISIVEGGFSGAEVTANVRINLGSASGEINLDRFEIDASGNFSGNLSVGEGGFKIEELANVPDMAIEFNSVEGITLADGHVELLTKNLKSDEGGLAVSYADGVFTCSGGVQLYSGGEAQTLMATSTLDMTLTREAVSGSAAIEITSDFKIPDEASPLVVCAGATANLSITNNVLDPISFNGDYKYGMSSDGSGAGGGDAASNGSAESESSSLAFEGSFLNCTYDINSGLFTGTASATLRSDLSVGSGKFSLDIPASTEVGDTSLTISFENSEPTQVSGTLQADASMMIKEQQLDINATIADFSYDCKGKIFSGTVSCALLGDFQLFENSESGAQVTLKGDSCSIEAVVASNALSKLTLNAEADATITNDKITGGTADFDVLLEQAVVDVDKGTISIDNASVTSTDGFELNLHDGRTKIQIGADSQMSVGIADSKLKSFDVSGTISGSTSVFNTVDEVEFNSDSADFSASGLEEGNLNIDSTANVTTTNTTRITETTSGGGGETKVDKIELLEGSNFDFGINQDMLSKLGGNLNFNFQKETPSTHLPLGYGFKLGGGINFDFTSTSLSGTTSTELTQDVEVVAGEGEGGQFAATIHGGDQSTGSLGLENNTITSIGVSANADLTVPTPGIGNGETLINLQLDTATFDPQSLTFSCNDAVATLTNGLTLEVNHAGGRSTTVNVSENASINVSVADNKLTGLSFNGDITGSTTILGQDKAIDFQINGSGLKLEGFGTDNIRLAGTASIETTSPVDLKRTEEETITLLENSSISVDFGDEGVDNVGAHFIFDYSRGAQGNVSAYTVNLEGDVTYGISEETITQGDVTGTLTSELVISPKAPSELGSVTVTLHENSTAGLTIASGEITQFTYSGGSQFVVSSRLLQTGDAVIDVEVTNATLDLGEESTISGSATATLANDIQLKVEHGEGSGKYTQLDIAGGATAGCTVDKNILMDVQFGANVSGKTTILGSDKEIDFVITGDGVGIEGLGSEDLSLSGSVTITMTNDSVTLKEDSIEKIDLLKDSSFTVDVGAEGIQTLSGQFNLDYTHAPTANVPSGYQLSLTGNPTYDVEAKTISGTVTATVKEDISIMPPATEDGSSISAIVRKDATADVTFESSDIKSLSCSGLTEVTINSPVLTSGPAIIDVTLENASIDAQTFAISATNAQADLKTNLTVRANHGDDGRYTEVTIDQGASGSLALDNDIVTHASLDGHMHGETTILGADKLIMYTVDGSGLGLNGLGTQNLSLDGSLSIITDNDVTLTDEGDETVVLLKTSDFTVVLADSSLDSVTGNFKLDYTHVPTEYVSTGFGFLIEGSVTYTISQKAISGSTTGTLKEDVHIGKAGEGDAGSGLSGILYKDSTVTVDYSENDITMLTYSGSSQITARAGGIVKNDVILNIEMNNATVDGKTFAVSVEEATAALQDPVTVRVEHDGGRYTEATIQGSATISVADNILTKATMDGDISGVTTIVGVDPIAYTVDGSGLTLEGLGSSDITVNGELNIVTTSEEATLKQSNGETVKLLKGSYFGVDLAQSSIDTVNGGFKIDYEHEPTEHISSGYGFIIDGEAHYKVASETLTGSLHGTLKNDVTIGSGDTEGSGVSGILYKDAEANVEFTESAITQLSYSGDAQLTLPSEKIKSGCAIIDISINNATLDTQTFAVSVSEASASLAEPVEFSVEHSNGKHTDITAEGAATVSIENNIVTNATLNGSVTGETSIFSKSDDNLLEFMVDGSGVTLEGLGTPDLQFSGEIKVVTTTDFDIDAINSYEVKLLKDSNFGIALDGNSLDSVFGSFSVSFKKDADDKFTNGIFVKASGDMTYTFGDGTFDGSGDLELLDDLDFTIGSFSEDGGTSAGARFSLKKGKTNATLVVNNEGLQSFSGEIGFDAGTNLETKAASAAVELTNGHGSFDYDIAARTLNSADVSANVGCIIEVSDKITVEAKEGSNFNASFDSEGIVDGNFTGGIQIAVSLGDSVASGSINATDAATGSGVSEQAVFDVTTSGLNYTKGVGFDGTVNVTCAHRTILGTFQHTSTTDGQSTTTEFEYGLGSAEANAVGIDIVIEDGSVNTIAGSAGLFLEQTAGMNEGEEPLRVHGDVSFDYDVQTNTLRSASGKVSVDRKVLFTAPTGDTLILEPSEVDLIVENNDVVSVSGEVNLALGDNDGEYLTFRSSGEFDCLNTKKVSGHVEVNLIREKELTKSKEGNATQSGGDSNGHDMSFWIQPTGSTTFSIDINNNEIEKLEGSIGFMIKRDRADFFGGTIEGSYQAATETAEESLDGRGEIHLYQDIGLPNEDSPLFVLATGSYGAAEITNSQVSNIEGELIILVKGPVSADGQTANDIRVQAGGRVDVASGMVEEFTGQAALTGDYFPLGANIGLTSLSASVTITNNQLQKISGSAGIKYETEGITIEGGVEVFDWEKTEGEAPDKFNFVGSLDIKAMQDKLHGRASVAYNTFEDPNAAPTVDGELEYQITDWCRACVRVQFLDGGWDNPIISGSIDVTDVVVMPGKQLLDMKQSISVAANPVVGFVPLDLAAGVGFGLSASLDPITVSGHAEINNFPIMHPQGIPDFELGINAGTAVNLTGTIAPFLRFGVGSPALFSAGLKITGAATLTATAAGAVEGKITGGQDGFGGELGLGLTIAGAVDLSVIPSFYIMCFGDEVLDQKITSWDFSFGELFNTSWGKTFKWSEANGMQTVDGGPAPELNVSSQPLDVSAPVENADQVYTLGGGGGGQTQSGETDGGQSEALPGLEMPTSEEIGQDSVGKNTEGKKADDLPGFGSQIEDVQKIAKAADAIGQVVSVISGIVTGAMIGGPWGALGALLIMIVTGKLTIPKVIGWFNDIKGGIEAIKHIISDPEAFIRSLLPSWLVSVYDFFKTANENSVLDKVVEKVDEWVNSQSSPKKEILQPVVNFVRNQREKIGAIAELLNGGATDVIKGIFGIVGFGLSCISDVIDMVGEMLTIFKGIVRTCIQNGTIYIHYKVKGKYFGVEDWQYTWKFEIPGLCNWSGGDDWTIVHGLHLLFSGCGLDYVKA